MVKKINLGKKNLPRLSLYPLTLEQALTAFMKVKPESDRRAKKPVNLANLGKKVLCQVHSSAIYP